MAGYVSAFTQLVDEVVAFAPGAGDPNQGASGGLQLDIDGVGRLIAGLNIQINAIAAAQRLADAELGGIRPRSEVSEVPGVNSAFYWLSRTAVRDSGLVSFEKNLAELNSLVFYLRDQLIRVRRAYINSDYEVTSELDEAAKTTFGEH